MVMLTLALAKGRILEEALPLLARAGLEPAEDALTTRKLILETRRPGLRLILVRAADVARNLPIAEARVALSRGESAERVGAAGASGTGTTTVGRQSSRRTTDASHSPITDAIESSGRYLRCSSARTIGPR